MDLKPAQLTGNNPEREEGAGKQPTTGFESFNAEQFQSFGGGGTGSFSNFQETREFSGPSKEEPTVGPAKFEGFGEKGGFGDFGSWAPTTETKKGGEEAFGFQTFE